MTSEEVAARLRLSVGRLGRVLRSSGSGGLTSSQLSALSSIDTEGPQRIGDLATREGVGAPAATRIVAALDEAGLVVRSPDPADARSVLVATTSAGRQKLAALRAARDAGLAHRIDALAAADLRALERALPVLERLAAVDAGHLATVTP